MSNELTGKETCNCCGHIIAKPKTILSINNFRQYITEINNLDELDASKEYLTRFIRSRCSNNGIAKSFLENLERKIAEHEGKFFEINSIRLWILSFINNPIDCDPSNPSKEMYLYRHLQSNYLKLPQGINETFTEFYNKYVQTTEIPLGKNQVSRTLNALGLKSVMKKIKTPGNKPKCCMVLSATKDELIEILQKNGLL